MEIIYIGNPFGIGTFDIGSSCSSHLCEINTCSTHTCNPRLKCDIHDCTDNKQEYDDEDLD